MKPPTDQELTHLAKLCEAATPGPWTVVDEDDAAALQAYPQLRGFPGEGRQAAKSVVLPFGRACSDATFIAAARQWLGPLLTEIQRLKNSPAAQEYIAAIQAKVDMGREIGKLQEALAWFSEMTPQEALTRYQLMKDQTA